ncbi:hypothetical protein TUM18999_16640 [Pseudomonas tohonis]|uniref:Metallo-beta-lactamase domain-containing protein n=1 Tax=Pseudomonas tohonis TaxID=2725477 RepID=A0A6J4E0M7_9PSED|nr:MBL fold metallo-hydrolase [Pseudomonas tohonis]BCG23473.1 hypothetical protein TUM18999_16640 [Pseudomonas tohonis]GJN51517.1 hypothetical protein TUM20286_12690 [Pseudomonas tohonis]
MQLPSIVHHGSVTGVTGFYNQSQIDDEYALVMDCGLFQGAEASPEGRAGLVGSVRALVATHIHIDHVGGIPDLLATGFKAVSHRPSCCPSYLEMLSSSVLAAFGKGSNSPLAIRFAKQAAQLAIVVAGSGMCSSGHIVNYLNAMFGYVRHDVLFVGF